MKLFALRSTETNVFSLSNIAILLFCLLLLSVLYQVVYNHFYHPLSNYPGPRLAGITRIWLAWHNYIEDETLVCWEAIGHYGPIVRVSPNLLLVSKAKYLPDIYHRRAVKTNHYNLLGFGKTPSTFHSIEHHDHARKRRMVAAAYTFSDKRTEEIVEKRVRQWVTKLSREFAEGDTWTQGFDFSKWANFIAYDVMGDVVGSRDLGCVENGFDASGVSKSFKSGLTVFGFITRMHVFAEWIRWSWIGRFLEWWIPKDNTVGVLMRFGKDLVRERLADGGSGTKNDMVQSLLDSPMTHEAVQAELTAILLAGADTISSASCAVVVNVLRDRDSLGRILDEAKGLSSYRPALVYEKCPYFIACVKESMRLYPSVPSIFPREVRGRPLVIDGREIPIGTEVACNPWIVHRDKEVYGADADIWRPERWLDENLEKYNLGFGYGSRICIGRELGMLELIQVTLTFLTMFEAELIETPLLRCTGGVASWENVWIRVARRV